MPARRRRRSTLLASCLSGLVALPIALGGCGREPSGEGGATSAAAAYVGRAACARCHAAEHDRFVGSHHDLAMQEANAATVLGDFDGAEFRHHGVTSRFAKRGDRFVVNTDGPDGALADFEVAYVFGVYPLQQYLVAFPGGRYQVLPLCWDARPTAAGGQRWYHLYGDEAIPHGDELHWTGPNQNWNHMCAACHSTGLVKGYDLATDSYRTTWTELDVSCEACHGPGSRHVAWADAGGKAVAGAAAADLGLAVDLGSHGTWHFVEGTPTARRDPPAAPGDAQLDACAPCHSRGGRIVAAAPLPGRPLLDSQRVTLLDEGLYHADGQILDEVYVYGSFVQSKMYHAGVVCSDCHEPHALTVLAPGNALCARCHMPSVFDTAAHHLHEPGTEGAACVACHMPTRTYMGVDVRRDHSIRIPRPDLSVRLGTPNACNACHTDKDAAWAAAAIRTRRGATYTPRPHYGEALHAGRTDAAGAVTALAGLLGDRDRPAIARATAAGLLQHYPERAALAALEPALADPSAHVRRAALAALIDYPDELLLPLCSPLLADPVLAVRAEAARVLAKVPASQLAADVRPRFAAALDEYVATQLVDADRPWAHVNLGLLRARQGRLGEAAAAYRQAIAVDPTWAPAYANLADLHREQGRDDLGEKVLREGLGRARLTAELRFALGLLLARARRYDDALVELERAARDRPDAARFAYTFAVALHSAGQVDRALAELEATWRRHPRDVDVLTALVSYCNDRGDREAAIGWARRLVERDPADAGSQDLLRSLLEGR